MIPHQGGADNPPIALPEPVQGCLDNVPAELRERPQWLGWRYEIRDGKPRKMPVNPLTGWNASSTNPKHRGPFEVAVAAVRLFRLSGVGFVFTSNDPYVGIDLDNALEEPARDGKKPVLKGWAADFCRRLPSYAEVSPSGTGVKIFARGVLPGKAGYKFAVADGAIEIYSAARYFTVTGARLPGFPAGVQDVGPELGKVLEELNRSRTPGKSAGDRESVWDGEVWNTGLSPAEVVRIAGRAKNGGKFRMLYYDGDTSDYKSESEADLALASMLAFYTGPDPERIERLFSRSVLGQREKWLERDDYRERTIEEALENRTSFYGRRMPGVVTAGIEGDAEGTPSSPNPLVSNLYQETSCTVSYEVRDVGDGFPESRGWGEPVEFFEEPPAPGFPAHVLPDHVRAHAEEAAEAIGCPVDFPCGAILATAASALGSAAAVEVKENWDEKANLYLALVGVPGSGKSPAMDCVVGPLKEINSLGRRTFTTRFSVEVLTPLLQANSRGLLIYKDELSGWTAAMNQFKRGQGDDKQFFLSAWVRGWIQEDYKGDFGQGGKMQSNSVAGPYLTVLGGIQPDLVKSLMRKEAVGDGFLDRILFCYPPPSDILDWTEKGVSLATKELWGETVRSLYGMKDGTRYRRSAGAKEVWAEHATQLRREINQSNLPAHVKEAWRKQEVYAARFMLLLHALWSPGEEFITPGMVERAWELVGYFKAQVLRVQGIVAGDPVADMAKAIVVWVRMKQALTFPWGDLYQGLRGRACFKKAEAFEEPLEMLIDFNWIRRAKGSVAQGTPGVAARHYEVNPKVLASPTSLNSLKIAKLKCG